MNKAINHEAVTLKRENDKLWGYIETVLPYLENDVDYIKLTQNTPIEQARYSQISSILRERKQISKMNLK